MKINVAYPATGCQKLLDIHDEHKIRPFYEKRMGQEVPGDTLGDEFKVRRHFKFRGSLGTKFLI